MGLIKRLSARFFKARVSSRRVAHGFSDARIVEAKAVLLGLFVRFRV